MTTTFDSLVEEAFSHIWALHPDAAVYLGRHDYDGLVPDRSPNSVAAEVDALQSVRRRLADLDDLEGDASLDRRQLLGALDETLFHWSDLAWWTRNPMDWVYPLGVETYLNRSYAPWEHRLGQLCTVMEQAPRFLDQARDALERSLPEVYCRWAVEMARGAADFAGGELPGFADRAPAVATRLRAAAATGATALRAYAEWIEAELAPKTHHDFAIGRDNMERLLAVNELVEMSLDDLLALGEDNLAANFAAFEETAASIDPGLSPRDVYARHVAAEHPTAATLISVTRDMLEDIRSFLVDHDIISVPSAVRALVAETPKHLRWAFAMMDTPGPYETEATEAYYYVTPVDPDWSEEQAEEWLAALNTFALEDISIHEAYPGHYVHFLHYADAPTDVSRRAASYAFTEGWAHYCEEMMWEEGYRDGDARFRLAQLSEALVRNCRFVCAIRMHAHGMSVDQATQMFIDKAAYEETPARKEAERGTFDPGYFSYTLGKLQIMRLRDDARRAWGDAYTLKRFHDTLLSRGAPPVELMREAMGL